MIKSEMVNTAGWPVNSKTLLVPRISNTRMVANQRCGRGHKDSMTRRCHHVEAAIQQKPSAGRPPETRAAPGVKLPVMPKAGRRVFDDSMRAVHRRGRLFEDTAVPVAMRCKGLQPLEQAPHLLSKQGRSHVHHRVPCGLRGQKNSRAEMQNTSQQRSGLLNFMASLPSCDGFHLLLIQPIYPSYFCYFCRRSLCAHCQCKRSARIPHRPRQRTAQRSSAACSGRR